MKTIASAFAAALIASASFAGVALAEGDYYEGASKAAAVDHISTGSIDQVRQPTSRDNRQFATDHGDYYTGANRPN